MKRSIAVSFGFAGTVIGAGFASGKEVMLYFSETGVASPLLSALFLGVLAYFFCEIGRNTGGDGYALFGKGKKIVSFFVKTVSALIFCTTVAASEEAFFSLFGVHGGSVVTVFLSLLTLYANKKISTAVSVLSVLAIVVLLGALFFRSETYIPRGKFSPFSSFLYAGMNMLTGGFFICEKSGDLTRKDSATTAITSFFLLSILLLAVFMLSKTSPNAIFPMMSAAEKAGFGAVGPIILYLAMYTTCNGTLTVAVGKKLFLALIVCSLSLLVSCIGFEKLIKTIYPMIGTAGCGVCIAMVIRYMKISRRTGGINSYLIKDRFNAR